MNAAVVDLRRHRTEVLRRLRNHQYERDGAGLYLPKMGVRFHGHFEVQKPGDPWEIADNLVVDEGLLNLLDVYFNGGSQHANFYTGCYSGNVTPAANLTAATVTATTTEIQAQYDEATRVLWSPDAAASNEIGNQTAPAVFTFNTAVTVRGLFLVTESAKGSTSGTLVAAAKLAGAGKSMADEEELRTKYLFQASST